MFNKIIKYNLKSKSNISKPLFENYSKKMIVLSQFLIMNQNLTKIKISSLTQKSSINWKITSQSNENSIKSKIFVNLLENLFFHYFYLFKVKCV